MNGSGPAPSRPLPELNELNRTYWTAGVSGRLHIQRCASCERLVHPPALLCPDDHSRELTFVPVEGTGTVEAWTINEHPWFPGFPPPYVIAYVALDEDPRARILTNLVGIAPEQLAVGMAVRVTFEHHQADGDELYVPLFEASDA